MGQKSSFLQDSFAQLISANKIAILLFDKIVSNEIAL